MISMRTGMVIIVISAILLNLYLMGSPGGRGSDYTEYQPQDYEPDSYTGLDDTPKTYADLKQEYEILKQLFESPTPVPTVQPK